MISYTSRLSRTIPLHSLSFQTQCCNQATAAHCNYKKLRFLSTVNYRGVKLNFANYLSDRAIVSLFLMHCWYSIGAIKKDIAKLKFSINLISERKLLFTCCRKGPTASAQPLKFNSRKTRRISIVHL